MRGWAVVPGSVLKKALTALAMRSDCAILHVTGSGLHSKVVDSGMLSIAEVVIPAEALVEFNCPEDFKAPVNVSSLLEQLKNAGRTDVKLEFHEDRIVLQKGNTRYTTPYVEERYVRKAPNLADLPPTTAKATMNGGNFKTYVELVKKIADEAIFEYDGRALKIVGEGGGEKVAITLTDSELVELEGDGEAKSAFGIELLKLVAKVVDRSDLVTVEIGTNVPGLFKVRAENVEINHVLAPRYVEEA